MAGIKAANDTIKISRTQRNLFPVKISGKRFPVREKKIKNGLIAGFKVFVNGLKKAT